MQFTDWAVGKLPYCLQNHVLFVKYIAAYSQVLCSYLYIQTASVSD